MFVGVIIPPSMIGVATLISWKQGYAATAAFSMGEVWRSLKRAMLAIGMLTTPPMEICLIVSCPLSDSSLTAVSERIPRSLLRGMRANQKMDRILTVARSTAARQNIPCSLLQGASIN